MKIPLIYQGLLLLFLAIIATIIFEHSQLDIIISRLFYINGQWLINKNTQPYAFIFYDFPKAIIILFGLCLLSTLILEWQLTLREQSKCSLYNRKIIGFGKLTNHELIYLLMLMIFVPSSIGLLKSITHVSCPNHLLLFNGEFEYLTIWQNMLAKTPAKCFPAAHASAGFSLYGIAYLPSVRHLCSTHHTKIKVIILVSILGWVMGLYKMAVGDHFFSHTLVSMLLSWSIACFLATFIFDNKY